MSLFDEAMALPVHGRLSWVSDVSSIYVSSIYVYREQDYWQVFAYKDDVKLGVPELTTNCRVSNALELLVLLDQLEKEHEQSH